MYCKECGHSFETDAASVCLNCGVRKGNGKKYCDACGTEKKSENQDVCLDCGKDFKKFFGNVSSNSSVGGEKTKLISLLLWFFLGAFGAHCFYAGNKKRGWTFIWLFLGSFVTCGITSLVSIVLGVIDLIRILTDSFLDGRGEPITKW